MGTLFQVYERIGNSLDEVYQRVTKTIIYLEEPLLKCFKTKDAHYGCIIEMY